MKSIAYVLLSVTLLIPNTSRAAPCMNTMADIAAGIEPTWYPSTAGKLAIRDIFAADTPGEGCTGCHGPQGPYFSKFNSCANCHSTTGPLMTPPSWLNFTSKGTLVANSYYLPGFTKAKAGLLRGADGTMPPGSQPRASALASSDNQGLCDQVIEKLVTWIEGGYQ